VPRAGARHVLTAARGGLLLLTLVARAAGAQARPPARLTVDAGAVSVTHATGAQGGAALTPALHLAGDLAALDAVGTWSQRAAGAWSGQGALSGTAFTPAAFGVLRAEAVASAAGSAHQDATRTGRLLGGLRLHAMGAGRGVWAGASTGGVWDGAGWRRTRLADAGLWLGGGGATVVLTGTPTEVTGGAEGALRYTDLEAGVRWTRRRVELGAAVGTRTGRALPVLGGSDRTRWASATATAWMSPRLAVVAAGGSYPVDFTQNFPGGRFAALGLRLAVAPAATEPAPTGHAGRQTARDAAGDAASDAPRARRRRRGGRAPDPAPARPGRPAGGADGRADRLGADRARRGRRRLVDGRPPPRRGRLAGRGARRRRRVARSRRPGRGARRVRRRDRAARRPRVRPLSAVPPADVTRGADPAVRRVSYPPPFLSQPPMFRLPHVTALAPLAALLAVAPAARRASAQESAPARATLPAVDPSARLREVLPADVAGRVLARIAEARQRGLPAAALEQRALKFAARGIAPAAIERAVGEHAARQARATEVLASARGARHPAGDEVDAGAEALRQGVDGATIAALARSAPSGRSLAVPLQVLGTLAGRGLPADDALARVQARLAARAGDAEVGALAAEPPGRPAPGQAVAGARRPEHAGDRGRPTETGRDLAATRRPGAGGAVGGGPPTGVPGNGGAGARPTPAGRSGSPPGGRPGGRP
jgi:hypothetical protein